MPRRPGAKGDGGPPVMGKRKTHDGDPLASPTVTRTIKDSMSKMVAAFAAKFGTADEVMIGFGDWSHTALRNQPPTMSIGIRRALRSLGRYDVLMVNEFRTSKACSKACGGTCERFRRRCEKDGDPSSSLV